ncbi:MAG: transposase [Methyloglobulus sp.]|nr:transposase [Methyloglobulus sp.]
MYEERKIYSADFKGRVALAAIRNDKTLAELALEFNVHPEQIRLWKQQLVANANLVFDQDEEHTIQTCSTGHAKIGDITAENEFLAKVLGR